MKMKLLSISLYCIEYKYPIESSIMLYHVVIS